MAHTYTCHDCGARFATDSPVDVREEAYQGPLYDPEDVPCPQCGSDRTTDV